MDKKYFKSILAKLEKLPAGSWKHAASGYQASLGKGFSVQIREDVMRLDSGDIRNYKLLVWQNGVEIDSRSDSLIGNLYEKVKDEPRIQSLRELEETLG